MRRSRSIAAGSGKRGQGNKAKSVSARTTFVAKLVAYEAFDRLAGHTGIELQGYGSMGPARLRTSLFVILFSVVSGTAFAAEAAKNSLWRTDVEAAKKEAAAAGVPVVLHFYTDWCGPCKVMEKNVLNSSAVAAAMQGKVIAVKVNADRNTALQSKYGVNSYPSDVVIDPNTGKQLTMWVGKKTADEYASAIKHVSTRYGSKIAKPEAALIASAIASQSLPDGSKPVVATEKLPPKPTHDPSMKPEVDVARIDVNAANSSITGDETAEPETTIATEPGTQLASNIPVGDDPEAAADETAATDVAATETQQPAPVETVLALDGYCPVTLKKLRSWKAGSKNISTEYNGLTYRFLTEADRKTFLADPVRYAPKLLGCDPVLLSEKSEPVLGKTAFGAYFDGDLYLFHSNDTRSKFKAQPTRFARSKHVLRPEDLKTRKL